MPRPRLALRLDEGQGRGLVLACAPAGYGKTVLLAEWVRRGRAPVAWLSLDAGDNDPARFWRHAWPLEVRGQRADGPAADPRVTVVRPLMTALINEATSLTQMRRCCWS